MSTSFIYMSEYIKVGKTLRNASLILLLIAGVVLSIWMINFYNTGSNSLPFLLFLGIILLFVGILILTRVQFVLWSLKKVKS